MATISGTIVRDGSPVGGAYVRLIGPSGEFTAEEYTKDDGAFLFHVVDGPWRLEVRAPGARTLSRAAQISGGDAELTLELELT